MQANQRSILRILDANANRAGEGLRTLEEIARFVLDSASLQSELKSLRHDLTVAMNRLPRESLLAARDTPGDVGTQVTTETELSRTDQTEIVAAAATRTQQAIRCLEEYTKTINEKLASDFETIRYRAYDCFARLELLCRSGNLRLSKLRSSRLYALIDGCAGEDKMIERIRALADIGVGIIQLRDSAIDDRTLFERARAGTDAARQAGVLWIINDRADIAVAADADGVHVGQEELPVDQVRRIMGPERLVGLSTHNLAEVQQAVASTADYIGCGPTFPGQTKSFESYPGCDFLRQVAAWFSEPGVVPRPAFAIGGITGENTSQVADAGFGQIAVTGALAGDDAGAIAKQMLERLKPVDLANHTDG